MKASLSLFASAAIAAGVTLTAEALVARPLASRGTVSSSFGPWQNQQFLHVIAEPTTTTRPTTVLRSSPPGGGDEEDMSPTQVSTDADDASSIAEEASILDKINNFLDTPILDANNRSDQGALAEALKEFVRDEPEIAQVTFSAVVVAILALLTKTITSL